jgi:hypothetical protein
VTDPHYPGTGTAPGTITIDERMANVINNQQGRLA